MSSILTNASALSALQALNSTQSALANVQNQVSTGLRVATAADNSAYWAIAAQLSQSSSVVKATNDAISQSQSVLSTATSAIANITSTLNAMAAALTQAEQPGAATGDINTSLASMSQRLTDAVNNASFNGLNILNGTQSTLNLVSGYNASATGGSVQSVAFTAQALTGGTAAIASTSTTSVTDATTIATLKGLTAAAAAPTYGTAQVVFGGGTAAPETLTVATVDAGGNTTQTVYTALDSNGNVILGSAFGTDKNIASLSATTTVTPAASSTTLSFTSTVTDTATVANLRTQVAVTGSGTAYGTDKIDVVAGTATTAATITVTSMDLYGNTTATTYTAADASGNPVLGTDSQTKATEFTAVTTVTPASTSTKSLLTQNGIDLTGGANGSFQIGTNGMTAAGMLAAVNKSLASVSNYAALIGATQNRLTAASTFNSALQTNYADGISGLVDADMNEASTRLQALQTQEQLGIQSLSVANQNAQLILKLFS